MEEMQIVQSLAALAHPMRLQVFRTLVVAGPQGQTPTRLCDALVVPGATLSFHLKELVHAGLVTQERQGRHLIYRASFDHMNEVLAYLTANCCQGEPCVAVSPAVCPC
jgi:ArsR family transcriptional regulator, arsenate/arsenite/antimonite-responsive transcriptional repressor